MATSKSFSKEQEARVNSVPSADDADAPPPSYTGPSPASPNQRAQIADAMQRLRIGDPQETIAVPMVHSTETVNFRKLFSKNRKEVTHSVIVRRMPREWYLKHYAKDAEGNYVGTEKPAVDAGLVFVPSKSTPEDLVEQVRKVAFGKEHYANDFSSGLIVGSVLGGGFALTSGPK